MVPLAGRRFFPLWARIAYRGRRSGREFSIPVAIGVTRDHFFVPLPFANAQWFQNVLAAGGCTVRWGGRDHQGVEPTIVPAADAIPAYGPFLRHLIPGVGIERFLRLRRA